MSNEESMVFVVLLKYFNSNMKFYLDYNPVHRVATGQTVNKEYYVEVLREFRKRFLGKRPALFKSGQWYFLQDYAPVHNSILVTDHLTKIGIKPVPQSSRLCSLGLLVIS